MLSTADAGKEDSERRIEVSSVGPWMSTSNPLGSGARKREEGRAWIESIHRTEPEAEAEANANTVVYWSVAAGALPSKGGIQGQQGQI